MNNVTNKHISIRTNTILAIMVTRIDKWILNYQFNKTKQLHCQLHIINIFGTKDALKMLAINP
jgi:hypothetical protein